MQLRYRGVPYEIRNVAAVPQSPETAYRWIRDDLQMQYRGVKINPSQLRSKSPQDAAPSAYSIKYRGIPYQLAT
jgi:Domain of unknown function (DUF4278)